MYFTASDNPIVVPPPGVLANDDSGDSLAAVLVAEPVFGEASLRSDGSLEYVPPAGFQGVDSLSYTAHILPAIEFVVDSNATTVRLDAELDLGFLGRADDHSTSSVGGAITAYLLPTSPPYLEVHLVDLHLVALDDIRLNFSYGFGGGVIVEVQRDSLTMAMVESGGAVQAEGDAFNQPENDIQFAATARIRGTGALATLVSDQQQRLVADEQMTLEGAIRMNATGDSLILELPIEYSSTVELSNETKVDVSVAGTVIAAAPFVPASVSAETYVRMNVGVGTTVADAELPSSTRLHSVYPNPFNPQAVVAYELGRTSKVRLSVFDVTGREVSVLADGVRGAGRHEALIEAAGLPSGMYFVRLLTDDALDVRRAVITR